MKTDRPPCQSILVYVGLDLVGDGLMKLPFLRALRRAYPTASITWLAGKETTVYATCMALRLARFNTKLDDADPPPFASRFFTGVPAPAGAGLVLLPMILAFQLGDDILRSPWVVSFFLLGVGALFVSSVPTYSFKKMIVPRRRLLATMLTVTMVIAFIASLPWLSLSIILGSYLISMPFSMRAYRRFEAGEEIEVDIDDDDIDDNDTGLEPV